MELKKLIAFTHIKRFEKNREEAVIYNPCYNIINTKKIAEMKEKEQVNIINEATKKAVDIMQNDKA